MVFELSFVPAATAGFLTALIVSITLVFTKHLHGALTFDSDEGVQKFHKAPTPRVGGLSLAVGYFVTWLFLDGEVGRIFGLIGLAGLPALVFGMAEDLTKRVGVRARLLATIASGLIFTIITGYSITHIGVLGFDTLLALPLIGLAFTAFAIGGAANAINIIDGFHGLASGTLIIILLSFALVGWRAGDTTLVYLALLMAAIMAGFFVVNFPLGKLFLGDAGAYFAGYLVAALAVMLPARNPEISPWISLLILGYPVTETVVSIVRRLRDDDAHPGEPDSAHLHHIVYRNWARYAAHILRAPTFQNAFTSVFMWALPVATLASVALSGLDTQSALWFIALVVAFYVILYRGIAAHEMNLQKA